MQRKPKKPDIVTLTPKMAMQLLEANSHNRPIRDHHVKRIARQITNGGWKFNGDTIKVAENGDVLDGQHRCWAVIESKTPVETIIVYGIKRDAFATIDTIRSMRSGADTLALNGVSRYRNAIASALTWLIRWQYGTVADYRAPQNKVENADIEEAFGHHPGMAEAVERCKVLRRLVNPSLVAFFYYVLANRDEEIAERMIETLVNPSRTPINDPFFRLRAYFTADHHERKDPLVTIAFMVKAANAAHAGKSIQVLNWKRSGRRTEPFPTLDF